VARVDRAHLRTLLDQNAVFAKVQRRRQSRRSCADHDHATALGCSLERAQGIKSRRSRGKRNDHESSLRGTQNSLCSPRHQELARITPCACRTSLMPQAAVRSQPL
jgi:hypothetical protein